MGPSNACGGHETRTTLNLDRNACPTFDLDIDIEHPVWILRIQEFGKGIDYVFSVSHGNLDPSPNG
jgi:hypothetical protein